MYIYVDDIKVGLTELFHRPLEIHFITSLVKEIMFLVALVCLSVCLSVDNIRPTQTAMNGLG